MNEFDPYQAWLGIRRDRQPPTLYQLLGISPEESDRKVIETAVQRQSARLRFYQTGSRARECRHILDQIAEASAVLLDPGRRKAYDDQLRQQATKIAAPVAGNLPGATVTPPLTAQPSTIGKLPWTKIIVFSLATMFFLSGFLFCLATMIIRWRR